MMMKAAKRAKQPVNDWLLSKEWLEQKEKKKS